MAKTVDQQLRFCKICGQKTMQARNGKRISWLMHLVLAIFTGGLWLIVFTIILFFHILTKPIGGGWTCLTCGSVPRPAVPAPVVKPKRIAPVLTPAPAASPSAAYLDCPMCRNKIVIGALRPGVNVCQACGASFNAEFG